MGGNRGKTESLHKERAVTWKTIDDMALAGKVVLTRVDIKVPMEGAQVTDAAINCEILIRAVSLTFIIN